MHSSYSLITKLGVLNAALVDLAHAGMKGLFTLSNYTIRLTYAETVMPFAIDGKIGLVQLIGLIKTILFSPTQRQ